jgi:hypothetical protein
MSNGHEARDEIGGNEMTWKSEIWEGLEHDFAWGREAFDPEAAAWADRIVREPWVEGLLRLTERRGWWVGTEEWLLYELEKFAGEAVYRSADFPRSLDELLEYQAITHAAFSKLELGVVDYREIPVEDVVYRYDAPEWDWDNYVLLHRGASALRTYYLKAEKHPDPLPLTLLLIAARKRSGAYKSWGGTTAELRDAILGEHGLAWSSVDEYLRLFWTWDPTDYPAFHERMERCKPFLEEFGVRVDKARRNSLEPTSSGEAEEGQDPTYWTIEVPAWKHKRGFWD